MRFIKNRLILSLLIPLSFSVANGQDEPLLGLGEMGSVDETVIVDLELNTHNWQEPIFSNQPRQREVASRGAEETDSESEFFEWAGEIQVLGEIPYTYPSLSRTTLQRRVLAQLEEEEAKTSESVQ